MVTLTFAVENLTQVLEVYDTIQVRRYAGDGTPGTYLTDDVVAADYVEVVGLDVVGNRNDVSDVYVYESYDRYFFRDHAGTMDDWYACRYYGSGTEAASGWSGPLQGGYMDFNYNPQFSVEKVLSAEDRLIVDKIRTYIGDPKGLRREFGEDALSSIHPDGKIYEMDEKGWPLYLNFGGTQYTIAGNPSVSGYKFLKFRDYINDVCTQSVTYSGVCGEDVVKDVVYGVDIWYHTFRHSDKEILAVYNFCTPPPPLNSTTSNTEAYLLQTSIDILRKELWEDATEAGAMVKGGLAQLDPEPGMQIRKKLLDDLERRLDKLIKSLVLSGISGVRIE